MPPFTFCTRIVRNHHLSFPHHYNCSEDDYLIMSKGAKQQCDDSARPTIIVDETKVIVDRRKDARDEMDEDSKWTVRSLMHGRLTAPRQLTLKNRPSFLIYPRFYSTSHQ
jgi:hypothetical protein